MSAPGTELGLERVWVPVRDWAPVSVPGTVLGSERASKQVFGPMNLSDRRSPQRRRGGRQSVP